MIPLLSAEEMRNADAVATVRRGTDALVNAAGTAVALEAKQMLGSCYGARVAVIVGPGLNGADGRVAAAWLCARGARVDLVEVATQPAVLRGYDMVIDAAFGLNCTRPYNAPKVDVNTLVLAVDLPSGVGADTGAILGTPLGADVTLALGAVKFAHVDGPAAALTKELRFAGIGIVEKSENGIIDDGDLWGIIQRGANDHKWKHAVHIFAGSPLMPGAAELSVRGALAGGASLVRLTSRGDVAQLVRLPPEMVHINDGDVDRRCRAIIGGPGLGPGGASWLRDRLGGVEVPVVVDADGLDRSMLPASTTINGQWVLTPHTGEFIRLTGEDLSANRIDAVKSLARDTGCVVLLKGPTTVIADPSGRLRIVRSGTPALATAGSGDVLSGLIGATISRGHDPFTASALAAHVHGRAGAAMLTYAPASALIDSITEILSGYDVASSSSA
jgi:hydroxyethylthiazole kinase-like uncharacterized protein yjeF